MHLCESAEDALTTIRRIDPRRAVICYPAIRQWVDNKYAAKAEPYESQFQFDDEKLGLEICAWRDEEFPKHISQRPRTLVLVGPTRLGKTQWARSLGPHNYFNSNFNFKKWNPDAKYCIIDDFGWEYFASTHHHHAALKALTWGQEEVEVTDKYMPKETIKGMPCIFICNQLPGIFKTENWSQNVMIVNVTEHLY